MRKAMGFVQGAAGYEYNLAPSHFLISAASLYLFVNNHFKTSICTKRSKPQAVGYEKPLT